MEGFVNVEVKTSAVELVAEALERWAALMQARYPGWEPQPANILTIAIEALGPLAADVAGVAAVIPEAVFRAFGTKLLGVPYNEGAAATVSTLWTLTDTAGHTIPQGAQVAIGNFAFYVEKDVEVKAGTSTAKVQLVAVEPGTEYNKLTGAAELVETINWVKEITLEGETSGGANAEENPEYQDRIVSELRLQAPRPVNAADFAPFVLDMPSTVLPAGVVVGRATSLDLYDAETSEEGVANCCTTWVTDPEGHALSKPHMEAIEAWLHTYLAQNFLAFIRAPSYTNIFATAKIHVLEGFNAESVVANVKAALEALLNPATWGSPSATIGGKRWVNEKPSKARYNVILGLIERVPGVAYVFPGSEGLKTGTSATPTETADITLTGPAPLPETKAANLVITTA
jgi:Baseplate J-like protein